MSSTNTERKQLSREALEFSPSLLSIQESPPEKLPKVVLYVVFGLFVILIVWSIFGRLDVVATAEGRLIPETYVKIVQPAESGIVKDILVNEGEFVEAGQVLMRMDSSLMQADKRSIKNQLDLQSIQLRRIDAELAAEKMLEMESDPADLYVQVAAQYKAHRQSYLGALEQENSTLNKVRHDLAAANSVLRKLEKTVPIYQKNADRHKKMAKKGYVGSVVSEEKQREYIEKKHDLLTQRSDVDSLKSVIATAVKRLAQITSNYQTDLQNERNEVDSEYRRLKEDWNKIIYKSNLNELKAPQAGILKDLATHTRGTVVSPGTVLMTIVPQNEPLQAEIMVKNQDVGFVHEGQLVKMKLAAYPFQKYGMIEGEVTRVGPDAMDDESQGAAGDAAGLFGYKAMVQLKDQYLELENTRLELTPGMQVVVEIHQGYRTVIEYLLSPVQRAWLEAGRER